MIQEGFLIWTFLPDVTFLQKLIRILIYIIYYIYTQIDMGNISEIHLNLEGAHRIYIISTNEYVYIRRNRSSWYPCFDVTQECLDLGAYATVRELWLDEITSCDVKSGIAYDAVSCRYVYMRRNK